MHGLWRFFLFFAIPGALFTGQMLSGLYDAGESGCRYWEGILLGIVFQLFFAFLTVRSYRKLSRLNGQGITQIVTALLLLTILQGILRNLNLASPTLRAIFAVLPGSIGWMWANCAIFSDARLSRSDRMGWLLGSAGMLLFYPLFFQVRQLVFWEGLLSWGSVMTALLLLLTAPRPQSRTIWKVLFSATLFAILVGQSLLAKPLLASPQYRAQAPSPLLWTGFQRSQYGNVYVFTAPDGHRYYLDATEQLLAVEPADEALFSSLLPILLSSETSHPNILILGAPTTQMVELLQGTKIPQQVQLRSTVPSINIFDEKSANALLPKISFAAELAPRNVYDLILLLDLPHPATAPLLERTFQELLFSLKQNGLLLVETNLLSQVRLFEFCEKNFSVSAQLPGENPIWAFANHPLDLSPKALDQRLERYGNQAPVQRGSVEVLFSIFNNKDFRPSLSNEWDAAFSNKTRRAPEDFMLQWNSATALRGGLGILLLFAAWLCFRFLGARRERLDQNLNLFGKGLMLCWTLGCVIEAWGSLLDLPGTWMQIAIPLLLSYALLLFFRRKKNDLPRENCKGCRQWIPGVVAAALWIWSIHQCCLLNFSLIALGVLLLSAALSAMLHLQSCRPAPATSPREQLRQYSVLLLGGSFGMLLLLIFRQIPGSFPLAAGAALLGMAGFFRKRG